MVITLYIVTICIGFLSPFLAILVIGHIQETQKLFWITLSYLIGTLLFIYSPFELYNRIAEYLLFDTLLLVYGVFWGCLYQRQFNKYFKTIVLLLTSIPLVAGVLVAILSLIIPLTVIGISDEIKLDNKVTLDNKYFVEENNWGWVASSGKEYRLYRHIIPGILKFKIDEWRENDMYFNAMSIDLDTSDWELDQSINIVDGERVLYTFNVN